ncbi:MAG: RsmD family RNA methyltransferase [Eggerthellaceae bacterium]|nr:RsmD family RNA methyltransferase [Eggerthellaceae bacterium]
MRVIAGQFKGRQLKSPSGLNTRPTTDRVKESLMSALCSQLGGFEKRVVLDAFAGSGALGIETLSRGAKKCFFFENNGASFKTLSANLSVCKLDKSPDAVAFKVDVMRGIYLLRENIDLVLFDPPYAMEVVEVFKLIDALIDHDRLNKGAVISYEHASAANDGVDDAIGQREELFLASRRLFGDTVIDILVFERG